MQLPRTAVYIDGFNDYFRLKGSPFKWLDYRAAIHGLIGKKFDVQVLRYFTARVNGSLDADAPSRQDTYLRALKAVTPELTIHEGSFLVSEKRSRLVSNPAKFVNVLNAEEKGSDVNLATHLLHDAHRNVFDAAFVMSNDTDLVEAIRLVRQDLGKVVGVIVPGRKHAAARLRQVARPIYMMRVSFMGKYQLPDPIPGTTIHKPSSW